MGSTKDKPKILKDPSQEELESGGLELQSQTLEAQASSELSPAELKIVKKIAYYISKVGLPLDEACLLVDVDFDWFGNLIKTTPVVRKIVQMKEIEYKKDLLKTLSQQGRGGDDKLAQWLLERRYPDQYGTKKNKGGGDDEGSMLREAIMFIQKSGDMVGIVRETSGKPLVKKVQATPVEQAADSPVQTIEGLLK